MIMIKNKKLYFFVLLITVPGNNSIKINSHDLAIIKSMIKINDGEFKNKLDLYKYTGNKELSLKIRYRKECEAYLKNIDDNSILKLLKKKKIIKSTSAVPLQLQKDLFNLLLIDNQVTIRKKFY